MTPRLHLSISPSLHLSISPRLPVSAPPRAIIPTARAPQKTHAESRSRGENEGRTQPLNPLLFFALTGFTLNHPHWTFGTARQTERIKGELDPTWLAAGGDEKSIDRLAIAEFFRRTHGVTGLVDDFRTDETECSVAFKGPAFSADATVNRKTGAYELSVTREGWVALINDLHKGRHTGNGWAWLIDVSAVVLSLVAATGLWLLFYVRRRRASGLWTSIAGTVVLWILYRALVK